MVFLAAQRGPTRRIEEFAFIREDSTMRDRSPIEIHDNYLIPQVIGITVINPHEQGALPESPPALSGGPE